MNFLQKFDIRVIDVAPIVAALIIVGGMLLIDFTKPQPVAALVFFFVSWLVFRTASRKKEEDPTHPHHRMDDGFALQSQTGEVGGIVV